MLLGLDNIDKSRLAVVDSEGGKLTYGEIINRAEEIIRVVPDRSLVLMLVENNVSCVEWLIASLLSHRLVPLILNAKIDETLYHNLRDEYKPAYIWQNGRLIRTDNPLSPLYPQLSHLLPTSGSTGSPKLVRHSYDNIEAAGLNISTFFELKGSDRPLMVLPLYYTMGLSMVFSHLKVGATILITGRSMTDPSFWKFFKEEMATSFTGVPYSYQILNLMRFFRMDLPSLELLTQGGGKMEHGLNLKFAEYCLENGKRWIATYGQSECTARMAWLPSKWAVEKVGSIGIAVPNGELSLINTDGSQIITPYTEGELCYRGKNVTLGYARTLDDLKLGDERHGFIRTGDFAYFDEDGCYYIVGRMGRFLKLFGMRVGLDECEQIIASNCQTESACVGTDEKMIVYITDESKIQTVKDALIKKTHIVATSFEIRVIDEIPKNEAGKKLFNQLKNK